MAEQTYNLYYILDKPHLELVRRCLFSMDRMNVHFFPMDSLAKRSPERKLNVIPVGLALDSAFQNEKSAELIRKAQSYHIPVISLLQSDSEDYLKSVLPNGSDLTLAVRSLNSPMMESVLRKADEIFRLKDQVHYLRQKFHESEKRFLKVIRSQKDAFLVLNRDGLIRFINSACEKQFGISAQRFLGEVFPYAIRSGQIREIDLLNFTGESKRVEIVVGDLTWENEPCLTVNMRDTSEQRRVEEELVTFRQVIHLSPIPIMITDRDARILYVNDALCKSTGYERDEIVGNKPSLFKSSTHDQEYYKDLWDTVLSGHSWRGQICNKRKDGQLYWEKVLISPVKNHLGDITFFISVRIDDVEKRKMEKARQKAETLKSVQELAGGIAHEFSQPLQVLSISMSLVEKEFGRSEYFEKSNKMIRRIIELVDNLKSITSLRQQDYLTTKIMDIRASSARYAAQTKENRILIIDDEPEILDSLIELLSLGGYKVDGASNGAEALERISEFSYNLIICDVDMPGMAGPELFKKAKEAHYSGYFVFMTGYEIDNELEDLLKMSDAFLRKPFELNELRSLVDKLYAQKNSINEA